MLGSLIKVLIERLGFIIILKLYYIGIFCIKIKNEIDISAFLETYIV